jgi:hypothetical protein
MSMMTVGFGEAKDSLEYHNGRGGGISLNPGTYLLASIEVHIVDGLPSIAIVPTSDISGGFTSSFGSRCPGTDNDNTLKLVGTG